MNIEFFTYSYVANGTKKEKKERIFRGVPFLIYEFESKHHTTAQSRRSMIYSMQANDVIRRWEDGTAAAATWTIVLA